MSESTHILKNEKVVESEISDNLNAAVENSKPPEWVGGPDFYTKGDTTQYFCGLLAASLIEKDPSLAIVLRKELAQCPYLFSGVEMMEEILDGDDPIKRILRLLRSKGGRGQVIRSDFPWLAIAPREIWEHADALGSQLAKKGWCETKDLGNE